MRYAVLHFKSHTTPSLVGALVSFLYFKLHLNIFFLLNWFIIPFITVHIYPSWSDFFFLNK